MHFMENINIHYVTCKDINQARTIGSTLLKEKLAACVNIIQGMESIYRWEGNFESAQEVILLIKSRESLSLKIRARITELHSYKTPCILDIPVQGGNEPYINWILSETSEK